MDSKLESPEVPQSLSTRKSLAWSFSQEAGQNILRFIGSIAIARLLTPDEVGVFALAMAANFLISSLQSFGIGAYLVRARELTHDRIRTTFGMSLLVSWSIAALVLLARHPIAELYDTPGIADVLLLVAATFFINPFGQPAQALLTRELRFDILHHIGLASVIISIGTSVGLAFLGLSYMALAWGMVAGSAVQAALLIAVRRDHLRLRPSLRHWREVAQFGGWLSAGSVVDTFNVEGNKLFLGGLINPSAVALFERGQQIPRIARETLFRPLGRVIFPTFARDIREGKSIGPAVEMLVAAQTAIIWSAFLTVAILAKPIIVFLFGENWSVAGMLLPYLAVSMGVRAALPQPNQILTPHGKVRRLFVLTTIVSVSTLVFGVLGALHSLEMFAILTVPASVVSLVMCYIALRPFLGTDLAALVPHYLKSLVTALFSSIPSVTVYLLYGADVPVHSLLFALAVAPLFWLLAIHLTGSVVVAEIDLILRKGVSLLRRRRGYGR
mgnify:CR=1 FL=1|tara:strand:- start:47709 stop:49205 length:1497 start_codon:yes stop_codon:yes gene_type:complete